MIPKVFSNRVDSMILLLYDVKSQSTGLCPWLALCPGQSKPDPVAGMCLWLEFTVRLGVRDGLHLCKCAHVILSCRGYLQPIFKCAIS